MSMIEKYSSSIKTNSTSVKNEDVQAKAAIISSLEEKPDEVIINGEKKEAKPKKDKIARNIAIATAGGAAGGGVLGALQADFSKTLAGFNDAVFKNIRESQEISQEASKKADKAVIKFSNSNKAYQAQRNKANEARKAYKNAKAHYNAHYKEGKELVSSILKDNKKEYEKAIELTKSQLEFSKNQLKELEGMKDVVSPGNKPYNYTSALANTKNDIAKQEIAHSKAVEKAKEVYKAKNKELIDNYLASIKTARKDLAKAKKTYIAELKLTKQLQAKMIELKKAYKSLQNESSRLSEVAIKAFDNGHSKVSEFTRNLRFNRAVKGGLIGTAVALGIGTTIALIAKKNKNT